MAHNLTSVKLLRFDVKEVEKAFLAQRLMDQPARFLTADLSINGNDFEFRQRRRYCKFNLSPPHGHSSLMSGGCLGDARTIIYGRQQVIEGGHQCIESWPWGHDGWRFVVGGRAG